MVSNSNFAINIFFYLIKHFYIKSLIYISNKTIKVIKYVKVYNFKICFLEKTAFTQFLLKF